MPAVPAVAAACEHVLGLFERRFFDEAVDREAPILAGAADRGAAGDIAEAGVGVRRRNAEGDEPVGLRQPCRFGDRGVEGGDVGDDMVARHHEQQRVGVGLRHGERDRRGGVARHRFDEQARLARAHLFAHHADMRLAAEDERGQEIFASRGPRDGLLEEAVGAGQRQELFGARAPRFGPQPGTGAAAQDNGLNLAGHEAALAFWLAGVIP